MKNRIAQVLKIENSPPTWAVMSSELISDFLFSWSSDILTGQGIFLTQCLETKALYIKIKPQVSPWLVVGLSVCDFTALKV